jgi:nucleoside-diphosphate-sugar epimerase
VVPPTPCAPQISCDDAARAVVAALDAPAGAYNVVDDVPMTRREIDDAIAAAVGAPRLLRPPAAALKVANEDVAILLQSNRCDKRPLQGADRLEAGLPVGA